MTKWTLLQFIAATAALGLATAGCATSPAETSGRRPWEIPSDAQVVAHGPAPISFLMTRPGMLYVYDDTARTLLNTTDLSRPENSMAAALLLVDKAKGSVVVRAPGDEKAEEHVLVPLIDPVHRFSIWFAPSGGQPAGGAAGAATTAPRRSSN